MHQINQLLEKLGFRKIILFVFFSSLIVFSSCEKDDDESQTPAEKLDEQKLLKLVNDVRTKGYKCGDEDKPPVDPVTWNDKLETAAYNHSNDMNSNNFFSHTGSDGNDIVYRVNYVNYTWKIVGENIASGHTDEDDVIQGWLNSPGHCKNIMDSRFKEMGISKVGRYWTQVFGAKQ